MSTKAMGLRRELLHCFEYFSPGIRISHQELMRSPFLLILKNLVNTVTNENLVMLQLATGQVWTYTTRQSEQDSRITILKVEHDERLGTVVHIHVSNVKITTPNDSNEEITEIGHMPFAEDALAASLVELESMTAQLPDFQDGYNHWRSAVDAGQGGIFTISVAEGVEFIANAMGQQ